jgi:hypothetical protein
MATHTSAALAGQVVPLVASAQPAITFKKMAGAAFIGDRDHGGDGRIAGTVKEAGSPFDLAVVRRVRLHRKVNGMLIREQWSAADGTYAFNHIVRTQLYYVVSFDHLGNYNAVIKDGVTPEAMP